MDGRATKRAVGPFIAATFTSSIATLALTTVLGKQVFDLTGRELDLGLLGLVEFAPNALLVLVTGTLADRLDRRRMAAIGMFGEAVVIAGIAWYASTDPTSSFPIFVLTLCFGIARAFATPPARALPADLVPPERLPWLTVRYSGSWQVAAIVGPVLGGFLYTVDVWVPYAAVALLMVAASVGMSLVVPLTASGRGRGRAAGGAPDAVPLTGPVTLEGIRSDALLEAGVEAVEHEAGSTPSRSQLHEALEGLRFIRSESALLGAISLDLFAVLFGGAVALLPAIAEERLHVGAVGLGWLRAAIGIGAALMTLTLAFRPVRRRVGVTLLLAVAAFGVGTIALGLTTSFAIAFVALAVLSAADAISVFIRATLVPLITPDDKRGRVLAVEMVFIGASNELGGFESGVAAQLLGTPAAVVLGGACTLAVAVGWWWLFPSLRRVDRFPRMGTDRAERAGGAGAPAEAPVAEPVEAPARD